jgi:hypothetical protein
MMPDHRIREANNLARFSRALVRLWDIIAG